RRAWALRRDFGEFSTGVHDFVHAEETFAEAAGGMERSEIVMAKIAAFEQGNGEGVADGHGDGGACGGGEIKGAGFFVDAGIEHDCACLGDCRFGIASERDERNFEALERV